MSPPASIINKLIPAETKVGDLQRVVGCKAAVNTSALAISANGPLTKSGLILSDLTNTTVYSCLIIVEFGWFASLAKPLTFI